MLFYDFEVTKYDWLVVLLDMTNQKEHVIINDSNSLEDLYLEQSLNSVRYIIFGSCIPNKKLFGLISL